MNTSRYPARVAPDIDRLGRNDLDGVGLMAQGKMTMSGMMADA